MMRLLSRSPWLAAIPLLVVGCGPSQDAKTPAATATPTTTEEPPEPPPVPTSGVDTRPKPVPDDWLLGYDDCEAVALRFEKLLRKDEKAKLEGKTFKPAQQAAAEQAAEDAVRKGADNWLNTCRTVVGTIQVRSRYKCALKARDLERFHGCMDGQFDDEAK